MVNIRVHLSRLDSDLSRESIRTFVIQNFKKFQSEKRTNTRVEIFLQDFRHSSRLLIRSVWKLVRATEPIRKLRNFHFANYKRLVLESQPTPAIRTRERPIIFPILRPRLIYISTHYANYTFTRHPARRNSQ